MALQGSLCVKSEKLICFCFPCQKKKGKKRITTASRLRMSFRYTNQLVGAFKQRILWERARRALVGRKYVGRCGGVVATCDAYGRVLTLQLENSGCEGNYVAQEGDSTRIKTDELSAAIKGAMWEAHRQLSSAKQEAYNSSFSFVRELEETNQMSSFWHAKHAAALPPYPWEALREADAHPDVQKLRGNSELAATDPVLLPALVLAESEGDVIAAQRNSMVDEELHFWKRVELIRTAQKNVIRGAKRAYKNPYGPVAAKPNDFTAKTEMQHVQ